MVNNMVFLVNGGQLRSAVNVSRYDDGVSSWRGHTQQSNETVSIEWSEYNDEKNMHTGQRVHNFLFSMNVFQDLIFRSFNPSMNVVFWKLKLNVIASLHKLTRMPVDLLLHE